MKRVIVNGNRHGLPFKIEIKENSYPEIDLNRMTSIAIAIEEKFIISVTELSIDFSIYSDEVVGEGLYGDCFEVIVRIELMYDHKKRSYTVYKNGYPVLYCDSQGVIEDGVAIADSVVD
jgi:hypothetical protein